MAFSNVNETDEYLALKSVSFSYMIYSQNFHSSTAVQHQGKINMYLTYILFRNWWTDDKGLSKLKLPFRIIENKLFLLLIVYVNATNQK